QNTTVPQSFTITVNTVNDAPSFTKGPDVEAPKDGLAQTVSAWATNILRGPPDEVGQSLNFEVNNDNTGLFSAQPAIAPDPTLTCTPAPDTLGIATATVHLHDNGGTDNGGIDTSADQTFTISILHVNVAPSFTTGPNQIVLEDDPAQPVPGWATDLSVGPPEE